MADLPYRIVIGLEVHVQLLTQTKLFCGCSTRFGLPPNSATCPVCIGLPGVLPVMNRRAFDLALRAALALNCQIATFTKWDRKNYYYPDLPKNYQISQYDLPFSHDGWLEIETAGGRKRVGIIRVHLEEDAGKMLHDEHGTGKDSLVDLNRAGTPLLEIVSQPELSSPEEAKAYLEEIRLLLREIGVSDCEMQEGSLRCDANINIHIPQDDGSVIKTPIVEVKNLNSFRAVERAMKFEAQRHYEEALRDGNYRFGQVSKATAGWDENRSVTIVQRRKEEASDYRYFPEPDLVPIVVDAAWLERARAAMGELPSVQRMRLVEQYGLSPYDAGVLTLQGRALVAYFEDVARRSGDARVACNWVTNQVLATLKERKIEIRDFPLTAERLAELIAQQKAIGLNRQMAGEVYNRMLESGGGAKQAMDALGIKPTDTGALVEIVQRALAANAKAVADFKAGKTKAAQAIKGAVMRETKGTARPEVVEQLILEEIQKTP
ncbi:MAG TPA: Asp-tRNA(Asn)/Glu-tRNA(Gln) amidotransferase subunit GatB [Gemmataceae bacterium]